MRRSHAVISVFVLSLFLGGCMGRSLSVRDPEPGEIGLLQGKEIPAVHFQPFGQAAAAAGSGDSVR